MDEENDIVVLVADNDSGGTVMVIEVHGEDEATEYAAQLLAAMVDIGKLPHFCDEVERRGLAWHAICAFEDDLLAFEKKNRWCGSTEGWYIVIGLLAAPEGAPNVPNVPDWGKVKAWLEYNGVFITVEPGYGVHVWDGETFEETFEPEVFVRAAFADARCEARDE